MGDDLIIDIDATLINAKADKQEGLLHRLATSVWLARSAGLEEEKDVHMPQPCGAPHAEGVRRDGFERADLGFDEGDVRISDRTTAW